MPGVDFNVLRTEVTMEDVLRQLRFQPKADRESNYTAPVPSTAQCLQAAERSRSTWPRDDTTATSATVAVTTWNSRRRSTSYLCTTPLWIYAAPWPVKSPGSATGNAPIPIGTTEKRHRY